MSLGDGGSGSNSVRQRRFVAGRGGRAVFNQVGQLRTLADAVKLTFERPLGIKQRPSMEASNVDERIRVTVHGRGYDRSAASVVRCASDRLRRTAESSL